MNSQKVIKLYVRNVYKRCIKKLLHVNANVLTIRDTLELWISRQMFMNYNLSHEFGINELNTASTRDGFDTVFLVRLRELFLVGGLVVVRREHVLFDSLLVDVINTNHGSIDTQTKLLSSLNLPICDLKRRQEKNIPICEAELTILFGEMKSFVSSNVEMSKKWFDFDADMFDRFRSTMDSFVTVDDFVEHFTDFIAKPEFECGYTLFLMYNETVP